MLCKEYCSELAFRESELMKGEGRGGSECLHAEFMNDVESERKKGVA